MKMGLLMVAGLAACSSPSEPRSSKSASSPSPRSSSVGGRSGARALVATPWPAVLPCDEFTGISFVNFEEGLATVEWLDGSRERRLLQNGDNRRDLGFTARLQPAAGVLPSFTRLRGADTFRLKAWCHEPEAEPSDELMEGGTHDPSVEWECRDGSCSVAATYSVSKPRAPLGAAHLSRWIDASGCTGTAPMSRLLRLAKQKAPAAQVLPLARDLAHGFESLLAVACAQGRCAEPARQAADRLAAALGQKHWRAHRFGEATEDLTDERERSLQADIEAGGTTLRVRCTEPWGGPTNCRLDLREGDGILMGYMPWQCPPGIRLQGAEVGASYSGYMENGLEVWFPDESGHLTVIIGGLGLAHRPLEK